MANELVTRRVEVSFVGAPPTEQIERASGVSEVEIEGRILRCTVYGSFQPFLEALRGHEVIGLKSTPIMRRGSTALRASLLLSSLRTWCPGSSCPCSSERDRCARHFS